MTQGELKQALLTREQWNAQIKRETTIDTGESKLIQKQRIDRARRDYGFFVSYYFPHFAKCACGKFQIDAANFILKNPNTKSVFKWARAHAKSTHLDIFIPLWLKCQKERQINVMVLVGKSQDNANTLLADIQSELQFNKRYEKDFGVQYSAGHWTDGEFVTKDGVAFFARGRGQSPRGLRYRDARPDYIVIDDLDDDELVRNDKRVTEMTNWVKEALFGALDGGRGRFIMVGNLIGKNSVLARIAATKGVHCSQINIYDKNGEVTWREKWTKEEVLAMEQFMGYRSFQKEYMNNPITEGAIFLQRQINHGKILPLKEYRQLICYTDPSFKNSATADYKATMLVGKTPDGHFHLIKAFAAQCSVSEMVDWHYQAMEYVNGQVPVIYYMEANFMQDLMLDEFRKSGNNKGLHIPILGDKRSKGDKFARIEAMQPLFERGLIIFNEKEKESAGMNVLIEQLLSFERGTRAHDDAPDALEGAIWILSQRARVTGATYRTGQRASRRY
jgi:predicted phage terminase large subunit-like protein